MAQASKRLKRERRERRKITINKLFPVLQRNFGLEARVRELEAFVKQANSGAAAARVLVMGLLAQAGGKLEVTAGTLQQAHQNAPNLGWTVKPKEGDDQTYVVTLVEGQNQAEETPDMINEEGQLVTFDTVTTPSDSQAATYVGTEETQNEVPWTRVSSSRSNSVVVSPSTPLAPRRFMGHDQNESDDLPKWYDEPSKR